jgi:hypothetical protein
MVVRLEEQTLTQIQISNKIDNKLVATIAPSRSTCGSYD